MTGNLETVTGSELWTKGTVEGVRTWLPEPGLLEYATEGDAGIYVDTGTLPDGRGDEA
jgi:hypothetical protein